MQRFDIPHLREQTRISLSRATWDPKHLILIHTGATLFLSLVLNLIDYLLSQEIGNTGGLGGMDRRNLLSTVQSVLFLAYAIALPFWTYGYIHTTLSLARQEEAAPSSLLEGFRHIGPIFRFTMVETTLVLMVAIVSSQVGSLLFCMTPWALPMLEQVVEQLPLLESDPGSLETLMQIMDAAPKGPLFLCIAVPALGVGIPLFYRFRFARLVLMDDPDIGAFRALGTSFKRTRGNFRNLLKLDLHFWWFHGLNLLTVVLSAGDLILTELGVSLPWDWAPLLFSLAGALFQLVMFWWRYNEVQVTYVHAFDKLGEPPVYSE